MGDDAYVAETQEKLGAIISAPKLTDKLLKKPPFRFLFDIVTNFMKATGLLEGLFTDAEANAGKDADKELKIAILQKVVSVVGAAHGETCPARPFKIIAGAEPEHTNKMLVMLAGLKDLPKAKVDAAVRATNGEAEPAAPPPPAPKKEEKPKAEKKPESPPPSAGPPPDMQPAERPVSQGGGRRGRPGQQEQSSQPAASSVPAVQALPSQDAAAGARPGTASARKAPPAVKSNEVEERHESVGKAPVANVISEAKKGADDDEEKKEGEQDWMKLVEQEEQKAKGGAGGDEGQTRGYLAQQAAQAKREQEEAKKKAEEEAAAKGRATGGVVLKTRKRDDKGQGSIGATEMTKLREQLQTLTKASNPLGKFLEALHEDVDTMARELDMWKNEAANQAQAAADAKKQTEEALRELNAKQQALEDAVNAKSAQINIVRGTVLQNDKTIDTLVRMVVNPDKQ